MKVARCRSCEAPVVWAIAGKSGAKIPLDAEPVGVAQNEKERQSHFVLLKGVRDPIVVNASWLHSDRTPVLEAQDQLAFYRSHFATCPNAAAHRKSQP